MSIADNLNRIKNAKQAIKIAINNKGGGLSWIDCETNGKLIEGMTMEEVYV
jgi:hypothetical protein